VDHGVAPAELPVGTVTFRSDAMVLCQTTLVSGAARCMTSAGAAGGRSLTATFTPTQGSTLHPSVSAASTILVGTAPSFTTRRKRTFIVGRARAFPVRTSGSPAPEITVLRGHLPAGLHFVIGAGRAVLRGTATRVAIGTHRITLGAANVAGVDKQVLRIIVRG